MKPSSWGRLRIGALLGVLIGFYLLGFGVGHRPQIFADFIDLTQNQVLLYLQNPDLLPEAQRSLLLSRTQVKIRFTGEDPDVADMLFLNFKSLPEQHSLVERRENNDWLAYFQNISPDFQLETFRQKHFLPILWQLEKGQMQIYGLWIPNEKSSKWSSLKSILQNLLNLDFQKNWLQNVTWGTTLLKMDESSLPEKRKASAIRNLDLQHTQW